jgi:hypothetical protein
VHYLLADIQPQKNSKKYSFFLFMMSYKPYYSAAKIFDMYNVRRNDRVNILKTIVEYLENE